MDTPAPTEYATIIAKMKADPRGRLIAVTNMGGSLIDSLELCRFWDGLRPDLPDADHHLVTQAWLATCAFSEEAGAERSTIRAFIGTYCKDKGWLK